MSLAYLEHNGTVFYSRIRGTPPASTPSIETAVTRLIRGLYQDHPAQARSILRSRIFGDSELTPMCRWTLKVAAKRLSVIARQQCQEALQSVAAKEIGPLPRDELNRTDLLTRSLGVETVTSEQQAFALLDHLRSEHSRSDLGLPRYLRDRPIAALLTDSTGTLLAAALNAGATNKTLHAEINLARFYLDRWKRPLPKGSRLYTTLKPCRMCAATLWQVSEDWRTLEVIYRDFDPGPQARSTLLDAHSPDRRQLGLCSADLARAIQHFTPQGHSKGAASGCQQPGHKNQA